MPFWWRRRQRFWRPRRYWKNKTRKYNRRRWPRRRRRRTRRTTRRRRRRRKYKVKRKRQTLPVRQWQPDKIVKCKIKGVDVLVLGGEGKQLVCYTNVKDAWTPPKAPGGGGFGCQQYSLSWLYEQYIFRNNIWTKSNIGLDLCRYIHCRLTFYRHPDTDFIISYERQPPFDIDKYTYPSCHPKNLLLGKHKILLLSKATKPNGKLTKRVLIKPPKQMLTKWFFQEHFAHAGLFLVKAAAMNLRYSHLGCCNTNRITTLFYLNPGFYKQGNWSAHTSTGYQPYLTVPNELYFWSKDNKQTKYEKPKNYNDSIDYTKGWFKKEILSAVKVTTDSGGQQPTASTPVNICRYNPAVDSGKGNTIWLVSTLTNDYHKPTTDKYIIISGLPLYEMLYGFLSFVQMIKKTPQFLQTHILALESPALKPYSQIGAEGPIIPLDNTFVNGQAPYNEILTTNMKANWWPNVYNQLQILNFIVESGGYVPKYSQTKESTWELQYMYNFLFKWGGPEISEQPVTDPALQGTYEVPDTITGTVQIRDPAKQSAMSILHPWDIRHGMFTKTAIKRMQSNISTDSTFQADTEEIPRKKKKVTGPQMSVPQEEQEEIQRCLHSLFESDTYQETEDPQKIKDLIKQQHLKQRELKYNILRLISDLKEQQNILKLQTGYVT